MSDDEHAEPEERELKFRCEDLSELRERLVEAEAERVSASAKEENWVLDRAGELRREGRLLRVRSQPGGATFTFKGPARFEDGTKIRTEREVGVDDHEVVLAILRALGYQICRRYEKYRETWLLGGVAVCLDHTPIGDFVEFEGAQAGRVAKRFRFPVADAERRNYLELYEEHRALNPEAPEDMVFS
ncbi:MAG: class IV adenylate cyclase [Thermoanaerobaculia bacterium]